MQRLEVAVVQATPMENLWENTSDTLPLLFACVLQSHTIYIETVLF